MAKTFTINDAANTAVRALIYQISKTKYTEHYLTEERWEKRKMEFGNRCIYCASRDNIQKEHIIECNQEHAGLHIQQNVFPACGTCNIAMANKIFKEKLDRCQKINKDYAVLIEQYYSEYYAVFSKEKEILLKKSAITVYHNVKILVENEIKLQL